MPDARSETTLAELAGLSASAAPEPVNEPRRSREISLDLSDSGSEESLQLADTWEFISPPGTTHPEWDQRALDLDPAEGSSPDAAFGPDPTPKWDAAAWQPPAALPPASAPAPAGPALADTLEALARATSEGGLGKALLAFCVGRFPRAYLLAERFGLAMVGRAAGPGSDTPACSALRVDLEEPSCLATASASRTPVLCPLPDGPQDTALFAALADGDLRLVVTALRLRELSIAFLVIATDRPLPPAELDELAQAATGAEAAFARLRG